MSGCTRSPPGIADNLFFEFGYRTGSDQHMDLSSLITLEQGVAVQLVRGIRYRQ